MKKQFMLGFVGSILGILTAIFVILSATGSDQTLSGAGRPLLKPGADGNSDFQQGDTVRRWMLLLSAVFITLSVPVAGTLNLLFLYMPVGRDPGNYGNPLFHGTGRETRAAQE